MKLLDRLLRRGGAAAPSWAGALDGLDLRLGEDPRTKEAVLSGEVEGSRVEIHLDRSRAHVREVLSPTLLPAPMTFVRAVRSSATTGDRAFDREVRTSGTPLYPLLGRATRDTLRRALRTRSIAVAGGVVSCSAPALLRSPLALRATLDSITGLSSHLDRRWIACHERPAELLRENATTDPVAAVRAANLVLLAERFPDSGELRAVCRALLRDPQPGVRLEAAAAMGRGGLPVLQAIVADGSIADALRARAFEEIVRGPRADPRFLKRVLHDRSAALRLRAIQTLGRLRQRSSIAPLAAVAPRLDARGSAAVAEALGAIGHPDGETVLIEMLGWSHVEVLAAAKALGAAGTAASVEPLTLLARSGPPDVRRASAESLAKIRRRLKGAGPGQLTISGDDDRGALSLPVEGALSFPRRR